MYRSKDAGIEASDQEPLLEFFAAWKNWCKWKWNNRSFFRRTWRGVFLQPFFPLKIADSKILDTTLLYTLSV